MQSVSISTVLWERDLGMHAISVTRISQTCDRSEVRSLRKALGNGSSWEEGWSGCA